MQNKQMNLIDLATICVLSCLLFALCCPTGMAMRSHAHASGYSTQLRGVHQGLVTFANSNKNWFPGINSDGVDYGIEIESRYFLLLDGDFFTPEYVINPSESDPNITEWSGQGPVTANNYSYAMLQLPASGGRREEWRQTLNSQAVVVADRNIGTPENAISIHTNGYWESSSTFGCSNNSRWVERWVGEVLWNDNHVAFSTTDTLDTRYGQVENLGDGLFVSATPNDALLIHSGN